ncbi:hypothetical protein BO71DRAFT_451392 [Aspergillus ellipticus CBS 707.79]|uniref:Uncharacterized protein n=1 Tax=Aspergillus ellipticus CBS 707.79 TaxID=1448320 RepID=A0A319D5G4_9EURO|nr:hypothetical protein BO71DRAFT_451392 [Aspergillus ellipticus CBS 707.79]
MAAYLSLPAFRELIEFVEHDSVYYFPIANGWIVAPEQPRNNSFVDFIVLRWQRRYPGDRSVIDHTDLPENHRLIPTGPPSQRRRNKFHVRNDSLAIDEMLVHMLQHETPNPR